MRWQRSWSRGSSGDVIAVNDVGVAVQERWQRSRSVMVVAWWRFPSLQRLPLDRIGLGFLCGVSAHGKLCCSCYRPHLFLFYTALRDGAHQPRWVGRPQSGHESGLGSVVGPNPWRSILTSETSVALLYFACLLLTFHLHTCTTFLGHSFKKYEGNGCVE